MALKPLAWFVLVAALLCATALGAECGEGGSDQANDTPVPTTAESTATPEPPATPEPSPTEGSRERVRVVRVIDGDTIEVEGGARIRYIGIDTPEATSQHECFGAQATLRNAELVEGKAVELEKDVSETDRYVCIGSTANYA